MQLLSPVVHKTHFGEVDGKFSLGDCITQWLGKTWTLLISKWGQKKKRHSSLGWGRNVEKVQDGRLWPGGLWAQRWEAVAGSLERGKGVDVHDLLGTYLASEFRQRFSSVAFLSQNNSSIWDEWGRGWGSGMCRSQVPLRRKLIIPPRRATPTGPIPFFWDLKGHTAHNSNGPSIDPVLYATWVLLLWGDGLGEREQISEPDQTEANPYWITDGRLISSPVTEDNTIHLAVCCKAETCVKYLA